MNRILSLTFALFAVIAANAQAVYQPGEHDNLVTVVANNANDDLQNYPLEITLSNPTISIGSFSAYLYIDDNSVRPWVYDEDEECYACDCNSKRCYKSVNVNTWIADEDNPKFPGYFYVNAWDTKDFKLTEGTILTIYIDATKLSEGKHTLHVVEPMCSYANADGSESASYFCEDQEILFRRSNGIITVLNSISALAPTDAQADTYDLQGRRVTKPTHGLYIQSGRMIIR